MKINNRKFKRRMISPSLMAKGSLCLSLLTIPVATRAQTTQAGSKQEAIQSKYPMRTIQGKVIDSATGEPLSGAIVHVQGIDGYSVLTADDGSYEMKVPAFATSLYTNLPDYNPIIIGIKKGEKQNTIRMYNNVFQNDYSKQTNILCNHSTDNMEYSNALNAKDEIQKQLGAIAHTITRNGTPGVGSVTFIQGLNSLNANAQPLFVIDGVIIDQEYSRLMLHDGFYNDILTNINPDDIENITVMRNGTALYGAKGANGVIIINTRRGKSMATRITATLSTGVTFEPKFYSMMDAEDCRGYDSELLKSVNTNIADFKFLNTDQNYYYYKQYHNNTNWRDLIYRNGFTQRYGINVEGGDNVAGYNLSVGYTSTGSTLKDNDMNRLNIRINTDIKLLSNFKIRFDAA
ncbi:MAG TPA: SusC/RagA family TonB-linked outer membrane protein, partial [Prevotella sp.]|nr:SusC/RagA family TonB-linked outer membrane protein [Prevotella sp.]